MDLIERAPLRLKLALLVAFPFVAAAWAISFQFSSGLESRDRLAAVAHTTELAMSAQALVRELQR